MANNIKIFYLPGEYPFCYYFRGYLPGVYGKQMVVKDFLTVRKDTSTEKIIEQAHKADVVVLQRPKDEKSLNLVRTLKAMGKKVIFENDDTYLVGKGISLDRLQNDKQRDIVKNYDKYIKQILMECDGAIASTEVLAKEYSEFNPNVAVLKNCIDPLDEFECKPNTTGKFRVGFIGSVTTNDDYIHIKDQIRKLDERGDVTIVVLGVKYKNGAVVSFQEEDRKFWGSLKNVEWHPYVPVTEYMMTIANLALDLALIPREESYFNECKSNLKFLEMSLLKIPVLAQAFSNGRSPYQGRDAPYLTLASGEWYEKIIDIKDNYDKYKEIAKKAHYYVLKEYNIKKYAPVWEETIKKLCK